MVRRDSLRMVGHNKTRLFVNLIAISPVLLVFQILRRKVGLCEGWQILWHFSGLTPQHIRI